MDADGNSSFEHYEAFVWAEGQTVLRFTDSDGMDSTEPFRLASRYLWSNQVDQLLAEERYADGDGPSVHATGAHTTAGETFWPLTDHLGSVRGLVDNNGVIRQHVTYDSFGNRLVEQHYDSAGAPVAASHAEAVDTLFGYTGRAWDSDTGLQYNRARWYNPSTGRWLSQDPIGFAAGDANLYRYVGNEPTGKTDPSGFEEYDGLSLSQAPPWYKQWWYNFRGRIANREPLISDPRASTTFQIGDGTYVAANSANTGAGYWIAGNLWNRTPLGSVCDTGLRLATSPIDETSAIFSGLYIGATNIHKLPQAWKELPDYQKQDIGINALLGIGATNLPVGQIATLNKLNTRTMNRAEWQAYSRAQRAYVSDLTPVSRWGRTGLYNGAWVMQGEQTLGNYACSFKWDSLSPTNKFARPSSGATYYVQPDQVSWPSGFGIDGRWKGIFGQRIYTGPETKVPVIVE